MGVSQRQNGTTTDITSDFTRPSSLTFVYSFLRWVSVVAIIFMPPWPIIIHRPLFLLYSSLPALNFPSFQSPRTRKKFDTSTSCDDTQSPRLHIRRQILSQFNRSVGWSILLGQKCRTNFSAFPFLLFTLPIILSLVILTIFHKIILIHTKRAWGKKIRRHSLLISAPGVSQWLRSSIRCFTPGKRVLVTLWTGGWVEPRAVLNSNISCSVQFMTLLIISFCHFLLLRVQTSFEHHKTLFFTQDEINLYGVSEAIRANRCINQN